MAGGTSGFNMKQSYKDNRSIQPGRNKMGDNPYLEKSITIEKRNPKDYSQIISHRFKRRLSLRNTSTWIYLVIIAMTLFFFILSSI